MADEPGFPGRSGHIERARDLTDTSTKGLFPQLTEVLFALADSHARLLSKVQGLRLEQTGSAPSVVSFSDTPTHALIEPLARAHLSQRIDITTSPISVPPRQLPIDQTEPIDGPSRIVAVQFDPMPDTKANQHVQEHGPESGVASPIAAPAGESEPSQPHSDMAGSAHTPPHSGTPDRFETVGADPTLDTSAGRDYNFFDDLDTRLAGLEDQRPDQIAE